MFFGSSRKEGYPTHYPDQHNAARTDVLLAGIIFSIVILIFSFLIILPAFAGWKRKVTILCQIAVAAFVGGVIITANYGHNWEVGKVEIVSPYKAASAEEMKGELGIHVSLRGVNITLTGEGKDPNGQLTQEVIDYNEHFSWIWAQGRFGFGYYAGRISRDFRDAVLRGVPLPILQLAEYFTFDGEGLRFGRYYRWAGWYSHLLMWAAFPTWILALIFFRSIVTKGATLMVLTGVLQLIAIIIWSTLRNPLEISVPFESQDGKSEIMLTTKYGSDYYLVLVNSLICIIGGATLFGLNLFYPEHLCRIFDIDVQTLYTDVVLTNEELDAEVTSANRRKTMKTDINIELDNMETQGIPVSRESQDERVTVRRKRVSSYLGKRIESQRVVLRRPTLRLRRSLAPQDALEDGEESFS